MQQLVDDKYHPILQLSCVKRIYEEVVEIPKGNKRERLRLIITSAGMLLFKKHAFPAGFSCTNAISPEDIISIALEPDKIKFPYQKELIIFSPNAPKIVSILSALRNSLFGPISVQYFPGSLEQSVNANNESYQTEHLISDRFLTRCLDIITNNTLSLAQGIYNLLKNVSSPLYATSDIVSSPLSSAYVGALCTISLPFKLIVTKPRISTELADYSVFVPLLSELFKKNTYFNSLEFNNISFEKAKPKDKIFTDSKTETQVTSLKFMNCIMPNSFKIYLDDFRAYTGNIKTLRVAQCNFTQDSFMKFIAILSSSPCFLHMESIDISDVQNDQDFNCHISQYLNSNELRLTNSLKSVRIANCPLDIDSILSFAALFNPSIEEIHFNDCKFLQKLIKSENLSFQQITTFDFDKTTFSFEGIRSVFNELNDKDLIKHLYLSKLKFSNDISPLFTIIGKYKLSYIESFDFSLNLIPQTAVDNFCEFITNMKRLKKLNITGIFPSVHTENIAKIAKAIRSVATLETLIFKGVSNSQFGESFAKVIEQLPPSLIDLDISGQQIGNCGMALLSSCLQFGHFIRIRFSNPNCSNEQYFRVLTEMINSSSLEDAVWNSEIDSLFHSQADKERIAQLKTSFNEKFGNQSESLKLSISARSSRARLDIEGIPGNLTESSSATSPLNIYHEILQIPKDTQLYEMLVDCVGKEKADSSPLENILNQLEKDSYQG